MIDEKERWTEIRWKECCWAMSRLFIMSGCPEQLFNGHTDITKPCHYSQQYKSKMRVSKYESKKESKKDETEEKNDEASLIQDPIIWSY